MINDIKLAFSENKLAIYISIAILFGSLILGYFLHPYVYDYLNPVVETITQKVQSGVLKLTFQDIFLNNLRVIFQMFIYGIVFCASMLVLAFNGFFVGYYIGMSPNRFQVLMYIIPHGIFEFSSCIIACASGIVLFKFVFNFLKTFVKEENKTIVESLKIAFDAHYIKLKQALLIFGVSIVLMVIAGVIEVYLTIPIAQFLISVLG